MNEPINTLWIIDYINERGVVTETIVSTKKFSCIYAEAKKHSLITVTKTLEEVIANKLHSDIVTALHLTKHLIVDLEAYTVINEAVSKFTGCRLNGFVLNTQKPKLIAKALEESEAVAL